MKSELDANISGPHSQMIGPGMEREICVSGDVIIATIISEYESWKARGDPAGMMAAARILQEISVTKVASAAAPPSVN